MRRDSLKRRVVCVAVYGIMHFKDLLGIIARIGYRIPISGLYSATLPFNELINPDNETYQVRYSFGKHVSFCKALIHLRYHLNLDICAFGDILFVK